VIVKSGDDCRQELLAMQLIRAFHGIFQVCSWMLAFQLVAHVCTQNRCRPAL
jgi:phosphatidylinositol kinase/protein kinase (PI-3  family)